MGAGGRRSGLQPFAMKPAQLGTETSPSSTTDRQNVRTDLLPRRAWHLERSQPASISQPLPGPKEIAACAEEFGTRGRKRSQFPIGNVAAKGKSCFCLIAPNLLVCDPRVTGGRPRQDDTRYA
jgi:hypothetical protein